MVNRKQHLKTVLQRAVFRSWWWYKGSLPPLKGIVMPLILGDDKT
jgi:hypothetical protein